MSDKYTNMFAGPDSDLGWVAGRGNDFLRFCKDQIRKEIDNKEPGMYELRVLMTDFYSTKLSAYFYSYDPDPVIQQMLGWKYPPNCCVNFYLSLNPVKEYCESREQFNSLRKCRVMTQDNDIDRLTWFAVDIDPEHPAGTSATDEEKGLAKEQAAEVLEYMEGLNFLDPEIVDSGNGFHLKYRIDMPNTSENQEMLKILNDSLADRFSMLDRSVKNASRILKLPGTMAMKGRHTDARPYRPAVILRDPH